MKWKRILPFFISILSSGGDFRKMKKYYADRKSLNIFRIILLLLVALLDGAVYYFLLPIFPLASRIVIISITTIYAFAAWIILPLWYRSVAYLVSSDTIVVKSGFITQSSHIMRISAAQHVVLVTTPFSKFTGMNFITVNALGGFVVMLFLSRSDAVEIYNNLYNRINSNN